MLALNGSHKNLLLAPTIQISLREMDPVNEPLMIQSCHPEGELLHALQMATHPDKNHGAAGALQASQRVNAANDTLSDAVRRKQYGGKQQCLGVCVKLRSRFHLRWLQTESSRVSMAWPVILVAGL